MIAFKESHGHVLILSLLFFVLAGLAVGQEPAPSMQIDPVTRYIHVTYMVPTGVPDEVAAVCTWSATGQDKWQPAKVTPFVSETALALTREDEWKQWTESGKVTERRAAGLQRTVVFNPYPEAQENGRIDVDFRVEIQGPDGKTVSTAQTRIQADNSDVVCIEDWSQVLQKDRVVPEEKPQGRKWSFRTGQDASAGITFGNGLYGMGEVDVPLPQLTYPLSLNGWYALFVCFNPSPGGMRMRLTGDERTDRLWSRRPHEETLWRWAKMDNQHLVLKQYCGYTGYTPSHIDYVRLVPLSPECVAQLDAKFGGETDKLVAGYFEPYSWAFSDDIQETLQHKEPLTAFQYARIGLVDIQIGRFGMKVVYESRKTDPLYYSTIGDPVAGDEQPHTDNVGKMQQYTNTLDAELRYARELDLTPHANFGASNCYPGSPLQGDFSKEHPDWMRGSALRFEIPEVRQYALGLYREALELGAPGISIDYCRYPETIDLPETGNAFMRELRQMADEVAKARGSHVPILVRFPATGVRLYGNFDYATWAKEGLVDYLCPSNLQGVHHHFDIKPYQDAVLGTTTKLMPVIDGLSWGPDMPGPFLWRVKQLYDLGVPGIYVYQADGRVLGSTNELRNMRVLASSSAVNAWWEEDVKLRPQRSKGIYISRAEHPSGTYHGYERLRVWLEGVPFGEVEFYLDDQLVTKSAGPPYLLGTEDHATDNVIPAGEHRLRVRARDGEGWLEQTFEIKGS